MNNLGMKIKELRQEKGLTQKQLAHELNISIPTLSHWECNYQEPSFKDLKELAKYFKVSTDYLLDVDTDNYFKERNSHLTSEENKLIEKYRKLEIADKNLINQTILSLISKNNK